MILGKLRGRNPFITATVELLRLNLQARVDFLIDTGAIQTVLHPGDCRRLQVDFANAFGATPLRAAFGIGGTAYEYVEPCRLLFLHSDGQPEGMDLEISLAVATDYNQAYPSLLGTDVLGEFRLTYDLPESLVFLE